MMSNAHLGCQGNHSEVTNSVSLWIFLVTKAKTHQKKESWEEIPKYQKTLKKCIFKEIKNIKNRSPLRFFLFIVCSHIPGRILALKWWRCVNTSGVKHNLSRQTPQCTWKTGASEKRKKGGTGESRSINISLPVLQLLESQQRHPWTGTAMVGCSFSPSSRLEARGQVRTYMLKMKHL